MRCIHCGRKNGGASWAPPRVTHATTVDGVPVTVTVGMAPQPTAERVADMLNERDELLAMLKRVLAYWGTQEEGYAGGCRESAALVDEAEGLMDRIEGR